MIDDSVIGWIGGARVTIPRSELARIHFQHGAPRAGGIWVVFDSDWQTPPGTVVATFYSHDEAQEYCRTVGAGHGWAVFLAPAPTA